MIHQIAGIGLFIVALIILGMGGYFVYYFLNKKVQGKKVTKDKEKKAKQAAYERDMRNTLDYFWKESWTFWWIVVFLAFFISLGFAIGTFYSLLSSILFIIISILFGLFAYRSYVTFEPKAKAALKKFEEKINSESNRLNLCITFVPELAQEAGVLGRAASAPVLVTGDKNAKKKLMLASFCIKRLLKVEFMRGCINVTVWLSPAWSTSQWSSWSACGAGQTQQIRRRPCVNSVGNTAPHYFCSGSPQLESRPCPTSYSKCPSSWGRWHGSLPLRHDLFV